MPNPVQYTNIFDLSSLTGTHLTQVQSVLAQIESTVIGQELLTRVQAGATTAGVITKISVMDSTSIDSGYSHSAGLLNLNWNELSSTQSKFRGDGYNVASINRTIVHEIFHAAEAGFNPDYTSRTQLVNAGAEGQMAEFLLRSNIEQGAVTFTNYYMNKYYGDTARLSEYINKSSNISTDEWHPLKKFQLTEDVPYKASMPFDDVNNINPDVQYTDLEILRSFHDVEPRSWYEAFSDAAAYVASFEMFGASSMEELRMFAMDSRFSDAEENGVVISDVVGTAILYGVTFDTRETVIDRGDGTTVSVTEFTLPPGGSVPGNGVFTQRFIVELDSVGAVLNTREDTGFKDSNGNEHYTVEQRDGPNGNWNIQETIVSVDGGVHVGPLFEVPSGELLATLQTLGHTAGSLLADHLADGDVLKSIAYKALLTSIGEHFGTFAAFLTTDTPLDGIIDAVGGIHIEGTALDTPEFTETFYKNLSSVTSSVLASVIVDEVGEALGIDGTIGGEIFNVVGSTVTTGFVNAGFDFIFNNLDGVAYSSLLNTGFDFSAPFYNSALDPNFDPLSSNLNLPNTTVGDYVQLQVLNAFAGYAGARLAGEFIEAESEVAALFGAAGSAIATGIATGAIVSGNAIAAIFQGIGWAGGPLGAAIGAFVGTIAGTLLGNLFGGQDDPYAIAAVRYSDDTDQFYLDYSGSDDGGSAAIAESMADAVMRGVNHIIEASGGSLRRSSGAPRIDIGYDGDKQIVTDSSGHLESFERSGDAIEYAALKLLKGYDLVGGHAIVQRAWHNSEATTLAGFKEDIDVAEAFQIYLLNPTSILALMMDQPDSDAAQAWASILQRAAALELHLPHERDFDGGWGEILAARGDLNPEAIPEIEGDSIIITDPVTGEETVLHHIIGPGYEIVRIEGTDGNDIIEVIVDGPSIAYIDAGSGDDIFIGHDGVDIFVGGDGNDTANGGDGNDWLIGGAGDDVLYGEGGDDLLVGGDGDDELFGGEGINEIHGGRGDDILHGDAGTDRLYGGDGNDVIYAEEDQIQSKAYGGAGDDLIIGINSRASFYGGKGDDTFVLGGNDFVYILRDEGHDVIKPDPSEYDILIFTTQIGVQELWFQQSGDDLKILVLGEKQSVTIENWWSSSAVRDEFYIRAASNGLNFKATRQDILDIFGSRQQPQGEYNVVPEAEFSGIVWTNLWEHYDTNPKLSDVYEKNGSSALAYANALTIGGDGDTLFTAESGSNAYHTLYAGAGDDYYVGGYSIDQIFGDAGDDYLNGYAGSDLVVGGLGNDTVKGFHGQDQLWGGHGDDIIEGHVGDDVSYGGAGNDTIWDYGGDDKSYGGDGDDYIHITAYTGNLSEYQGVMTNNIAYGDAGDDLIVAEFGNNRLSGGDGNDTIISAFGRDIITGDAGDDILYGGGGNDFVSGGTGNDFVSGGAGNDSVFGNEGDDILLGGTGINLLNGGQGNDRYIIDTPNSYITLSDNVNTGRIDVDHSGVSLDSFTMRMSVRTEDTSAYALMSYAVSSDSFELMLYKNSSGTVYLYLDGSGDTTNLNLTDGEWHDLHITWQSSDGDLKIYDNGVLIKDTTFRSGHTISGDGELVIGQEYASINAGISSDRNLEGDVLDFGLWDSVLDVSDFADGASVSGAVAEFKAADLAANPATAGATLVGDAVVSAGYSLEEPPVVVGAPDSYITLSDTTNMGQINVDHNGVSLDSMTMRMSVRTEDTSAYALMSYVVDNNDEIMLYKNSSGVLSIYIDGSQTTTNLNITDGEWHNIHVIWNSSDGDLKVYDNDVLIRDTTHKMGHTISGGGDLYIGQQYSSSTVTLDRNLEGDVSSFGIWNSVLDVSDFSNGASVSGAVAEFRAADLAANPATSGVTLVGDAVLVSYLSPIEKVIANHIGTHVIEDTDGINTLEFQQAIKIEDLFFVREVGNEYDLDIYWHDEFIVKIKDQFFSDTITNFEFYGGDSYIISDFTIEIRGTSGADVLNGSSLDETLLGHDGGDILYGGDGSDSFIFKSSSAFTGIDVVGDFDLSENDKLDISDLLIGYDALTDLITDFVQITDDGTHSTLYVDADGGADNFVQVANLFNVTGLTDEDALETSGNLITV